MNISQTKFKENEIPYHEFEKVGIKRADIFAWKKKDLELLLSGRRTSLLTISGLNENGKTVSKECKFSLYRKSDNSVSFKYHPVRPEFKPDVELSAKETKKLLADQVIVKSINNEKYLLQRDPETNELLKAKRKSVIAPTHIMDVELSQKQRENFRDGKEIQIESGGKTFQVGLNLNEVRGLKITEKSFEQKQKENYDKANPQVIGTIQTDENRNEYLKYQQGKRNTDEFVKLPSLSDKELKTDTSIKLKNK